ncbi:GNAT family N-acetyltransferase [Candidatus Pantoea multigeneris]|uniref:GNAT family N-acetyltransferase n=1 Tax=Candidatus Pantoea multigeneris TaxID=2608357 RepID=A0ABX0RFC9_9GAMM|nr:GNAT family N-acetyltransferase [Pantoea multigeneris]NIF22374.1 GNAT family N-acetyltransferase [Pantoea multigeneris]
MSQQFFRDVSPEDAELQPILTGLFGEYATRYGDFFRNQPEVVELTEWYLPPQGLFIVLERDGEIIAMGAYKPYDENTAELKRIWTRSDLRRQGLAAQILHELERRALLAGYQRIFLTTGFRQPEAVRLYISYGYQPQFDTTGDMERYGQPPHDGRLRFLKTIGAESVAQASIRSNNEVTSST